MTPIRKLLIANRGEIAVRIIRSARVRGIRTTAVFSDADRNAYHVRCADEAVHIGGSAPSESYLNIDAMIDAAKQMGADAIHPGYGFLSERADFALACAKAEIIFIGPQASAIAAMGDKAQARRRMMAAGVTCVPGYDGDEQNEDSLIEAAAKIGFPVMVKASAGGGGRGMRIVHKAADLPDALTSARTESESAFGDGRLLLEKAITGARHIEIQVLADTHGHVLHLGERECSLQRRRQKVIEEAPSPVITPELRESMGAVAVQAARAVGYEGAGTVEFLFDPETKEFYFLEMNTRLQVEHPITEYITGLDLVDLQFEIAEGKPLALKQEDVKFSGWAIEARLYAENPSLNFMPQTGVITAFEFSRDEGVRVDSGVEAGDEITSHYDPMMAKIIGSGPDRETARRRLIAALENGAVLGVSANQEFLIGLLRDEAFVSGKADIDYIEHNLDSLCPPTESATLREIALAAAVSTKAPAGALLTGWNSRGAQPVPIILQCGDEVIHSAVIFNGDMISVSRDNETAHIQIGKRNDGRLTYFENGATKVAYCVRNHDVIDIKDDGVTRRFLDLTYAPAGDQAIGADAIFAPMAGLVTGISVSAGDTVRKGQTVVTIEAMKMEHQLKAPRDGLVAEVLAGTGIQVSIRTKLITLTAEI